MEKEGDGRNNVDKKIKKKQEAGVERSRKKQEDEERRDSEMEGLTWTKK